MGGMLKAIPSAACFSLFLPAICWDLLRGGPLTAGWSRGGAQVMLHAPLQTWPCGVLKEKADCTRWAD